MIMCVFAICILWLTSLQICVAIVETNIKIPSFSSVITNCKYAYSVVKEQSNYYSDCTSRQVAMCRENLDVSYVNEKFRVHENQLSNTQFLNAYQQSVGNCSSSVSAAKGAVSAWTGLGVTYSIPYYANCTGKSSVGFLFQPHLKFPLHNSLCCVYFSHRGTEGVCGEPAGHEHQPAHQRVRRGPGIHPRLRQHRHPPGGVLARPQLLQRRVPKQQDAAPAAARTARRGRRRLAARADPAPELPACVQCDRHPPRLHHPHQHLCNHLSVPHEPP